jgi:hypothetical protein
VQHSAVQLCQIYAGKALTRQSDSFYNCVQIPRIVLAILQSIPFLRLSNSVQTQLHYFSLIAVAKCFEAASPVIDEVVEIIYVTMSRSAQQAAEHQHRPPPVSFA